MCFVVLIGNWFVQFIKIHMYVSGGSSSDGVWVNGEMGEATRAERGITLPPNDCKHDFNNSLRLREDWDWNKVQKEGEKEKREKRRK